MCVSVVKSGLISNQKSKVSKISFSQELLKMFNDSESFYYSPTGDLTNSLQRQFSGKHSPMDPLWKKVGSHEYGTQISYTRPFACLHVDCQGIT